MLGESDLLVFWWYSFDVEPQRVFLRSIVVVIVHFSSHELKTMDKQSNHNPTDKDRFLMNSSSDLLTV